MNYKYLNSLEKFGINLGLYRIEYLLQKLGNPHLKFKSIHVAGTNGKGSTCAMLASILKEAGYKVGLYTSPHLFDYTERIKINGNDISKKDFSEGIRRVKRAAENLKEQPTVFEVLTAVAFWYFAKGKIDYVVVEVGLGGRLDATNVITPLVSVITNIDYEHIQVLGKTLVKIAKEKAGIIKPGIPVVTAENKREPLGEIKKVCRKRDSFLIAVSSKQYAVDSNLNGKHQKINAACAITAIRLAGIKVSKKAVAAGLRKVKWPARFQIVQQDPLTIVDGAHNPAGIKVLVDTLREKFPGKKFSFIIGMQKDKDIQPMLFQLQALAKEIIATRSSHKQARGFIPGYKEIPLKRALILTEHKDRVITGSLFLAADTLKSLDAQL